MKQGFSLVELSVVLVIIGLLVGGVITGQSLIRASRLVEMSTKVEHYRSAAKSFQDQYYGLPGDLPYATDFWPIDPAGCTNGGGTSGVCNGNGDGEIMRPTGGVGTAFCESMEFWRHLSAAGLIDGQYVMTGLTGTNCYGPDVPAAGVHFPRTKVNKNAGFGIYWYGNITNAAAYPGTVFFTGNHGNIMTVGIVSVNRTNISPFLSPEEAWNIDKKLDDGSPDSGKVMSPRGPGTIYTWLDSCATSGTTGSADYDLSNEDRECFLAFPNFLR